MGRFQSGPVMITPGVENLMNDSLESAVGVLACIGRHLNCDWGDIDDESRQMNDDAVECEEKGEPTERIMSMYNSMDQTIWVITEWDRSVTTVLLPEEY